MKWVSFRPVWERTGSDLETKFCKKITWGNNAGVTDGIGKMFSVAGDKQIGFGGLGTFQNAIVVLVLGNGETLLWRDHFRNFFNAFQKS